MRPNLFLQHALRSVLRANALATATPLRTVGLAKYDGSDRPKTRLFPRLKENIDLRPAVEYDRYEAAFDVQGESVLHALEDTATSRWLDNLETSLAQMGVRQHLVVLFGELGRPAAIDLESKFSEVGLASVQLADFRNFAHGRHNWLDKHLSNTVVVSIEIGQEAALASRTLRLLPNGALGR